MIIAIDGPSGAGKSTVAKAVAKKLGFSCLDTGAMYRAVAFEALSKNIDLDDVERVGKVAHHANIEFGLEEGNPIPKFVYINGRDVTDEIRTSEIDKAVSPVSANKKVREALLIEQQRIGKTGDFVVEGRDIGTVVFPDAEVKVFLTASPEERAHRRVRQNVDRGVGSIDYEYVLADIKRRDEVDTNRETAPLKAADDAHVIDSTSHYIEDVIDEICALARNVK